VVYDLPNSAIFNALEGPLTSITRSRHYFDAEYLRNGTRYRHSFNGPTRVSLWWAWVTLWDI